MNKDRLQEIKSLLEDQQVPKKDVQWLISKVEQLQVYILNETVPKQFDTGHLIAEKQNAERLYIEALERNDHLENALVEIAGISDTSPYRESELMRNAAKQALENDNKIL